GVSLLLKSDKKSQHLSVTFLCPSLLIGIFAYLYSLKIEFLPSNCQTQDYTNLDLTLKKIAKWRF
ncbi:hypothetical protein, partial [Mesomycoplasma ovipneumoniae]|uniref:hypothetical protein n=1 Tax=Mesomycoplasma ovipneumoniae TaxID=29562 RepID=UPI0029654C66